MIGFLAPHILPLLVVVPFLVLGAAAALRSIHRVTASLTGVRAALKSRFSSFCYGLLIAMPILVGLFGIARPYSSHEVFEVAVSGSEVMFVLDISQSMLAKDVAPSRIVLAKRKMVDLINLLRSGGSTHRFGITLFAGAAYLYCPLTSDVHVLRQFIDSISPSLVTSKGSDLSSGLKVAVERLIAVKAKSPRIVVISDGEESSQGIQNSIEESRKSGIPIDVLGVGTIDGAPIEVRTGVYLRDSRGETVISKLREQELQGIAQETGGRYVRAEMLDNDIATIAKETRTKFGAEGSVTTKVDVYGEIGPWCAAVIALYIAVLCAAPIGRLRVQILFLFTALTLVDSSPLAPSLALAQSGEIHAITDTPEKVKEDSPSGGSPEEQLEELFEAHKKDPNNRRQHELLAAALFKAGRAKEAAQEYKKLADTATRGFEYFENRYNEGTSSLAAKRLDEAIASLKDALQSKPNDERALHNLKIAEQQKLLMQEQSKQNAPQKEQKESEQEQQDPTEDQQSSESQNNEGQSSSQADDSPQQGSSSEQQSSQQKEQPDAPANGEQSPSEEEAEKDRSGETGEQNSEQQERQKESTLGDSAPDVSSTEENAKDGGASKEDPPKQEQSSAGSALSGAENSKTSAYSAEQNQRSEEQAEAELWLDSLPDSPLLLRRHGGASVKGGQTW